VSVAELEMGTVKISQILSRSRKPTAPLLGYRKKNGDETDKERGWERSMGDRWEGDKTTKGIM
jgi:hypothetical protein